jgi:hypothetical protein
MKTTLTKSMRKVLLTLVLMAVCVITGFAQSHVALNISNCSATANSFSYDVTVTNDGTTGLQFNSATIRLLHGATVFASGTNTLTASYVPGSSAFAAVYQTPGSSFTLAYGGTTTRTITLTMSTANYTQPSAITLPPGVPMNIGRFTITNTAQNFAPNGAVGMNWNGTTSGVVCYVDAAPSTTALNTATTRTLGAPCTISIPAGCAVVAAASGSVPPTCLGGSNGSTQITVSGSGSESASGNYSLDGGPNTPYSSNSFTITGLSSGNHTLSGTTGSCTWTLAGGFTIGAGANPDDGNPCTADACSVGSGVTHTPLNNTGGGTTDGLVCTSDDCVNGNTVHNSLSTDDGNPCTTDGCSEPGGVFHTPLNNIGGGTSDGLVCTSDDCVNGNTVHNSLPTDDNNPCTTDGCSEPGGVFHTPLNNIGGGTSDGLACTSDDCVNGNTVHNSLSTDDGNPCTTDGCAEPGGVFHTPLNNIGGGTDDGLVCTSDDCVNGNTVHNAVNSNDNNPCTTDGCSEPGGVFHTPLNNIGGGSSDGLACTSDDCVNGNTVHNSLSTDDGNPCTTDGCAEPGGVFHTPLNNIGGGTDDGLVCTSDDCVNGSTVHNAVNSNDNNPCTTDGCAEPGGVFHTPLNNIGGGSSDGLACTSDDCVNGNTVHNSLSTDDGNPCTTDGCAEPGGVFHTPLNNIGGGTSDGLVCTSDDCVNGNTVHNSLPTNDNNPCTTDGCSEPGGVFHTPLNNIGGGSSDGLACTSDDCVNGNTVHNSLPTDDGNPCTTDGCTEPGGVFHTPLNNTGGGSSDGLVCTSDDCVNGNTVHNSLPTNDNNPCTTDGCSEPGGVFHTPLNNTGGGSSDGLVCTSDDCVNGNTVHNSLPTDDNNPCTTDGCSEPGGVFHTPLNNIGGGTNDGLVCTSDDCVNGNTVHNAVNSNDNNPCTTDGCAEPGGVFHTPLNNIGGGSSDGLVCTSDDCVNGNTVHNAVNSNDNNPCTTDGCSEPGGVFHTPLNNIGGGSSDGLVCTSDDCVNGNTVHNSVSTNDGNPCTIDGCNEPGGVFHNPNPVNVTAVPAAPIQCFGYTTCVNVSATGGSGSYSSGTGPQCGLGMGDYTFTVTDNNGCSGTSSNVHLSEPDKIEATTSTTPSNCGFSTGTASVVNTTGGSGNYTNYSWNSVPSQNGTTATGLAGGTYTVTITDDAGCSGTSTAVVTSTGASPAQPSAIAGPAGACKGQIGVVYTVANVPGMSYTWQLPAGASGSSTTNSISVNFSLAYAGGFICVTATNGCGTSSPSCLPVPVITGRPAFPATPSGPSISVCGPTTVTYSIPPAANATNYVWTCTGTGFTLASGQGTTSITVNVAAGFSSGQVRVYATSCSGISGENSQFVYGSINSQPQQAIFPNVGVCGGSTYQYCVTPFNGATSITWSGPAGSLINGLPTPQTLAGDAYCVNITFPAGFVSGNVSVFGSSGCGNGPARTVAVRSTPSQPASITGPVSNLCNQSNVTYTVAAVTGASTYTWSVPAGVTMVSANNTGSLTMTVNFGPAFTTAGNICVTANNSCGAGASRCVSVTPRPDQPGVISGPSSVCKSQSSVNYSVAPVAGVTYAWSITGGASVVGAGANATVNFTSATLASATLTVTASNACGAASAPRTQTISVNLGCRTANEAAVASEMNAYPNPTSGKLNVSFNASAKEKYTLKVTDLIGNVLISQPSLAQEGVNLQEIDLSTYAKGMYLLSIEKEGAEIQTMRIVVE